MACDGKRVYAIFVDGDLVCLDLDGKTVWSKNLGMPDSIYSFATSLVVYRDLLLIQYDQGDVGDGLSVLYALECKTGRIVWRTARPVGGSWTSPILIDTGDEEQLITCSDPWIIAYNPATGQELWRADLLGMDLAPSPIFAGGMVFVIKPNEMLVALRVDGRGDVTKTHVVWSDDFPAPDICSPVSDGELIFLLGTAGTLSCFEVEDGTLCWEHELDDMFQASPSLANGWVYLVSEKGVTYRVKAAKTFEEAGTSRLDDLFTASPAFMDGRIFIRGDLSLYCIGND
jgi:outer membrane protein assembly factor BamB